MKSLLFLFLAVGASAIDVSKPDMGARVIAQVLYTDVGVTTTTTAAAMTHFSTVTVSANTLARNGDSLVVKCNLTYSGASQYRDPEIYVNGISISSATSAGIGVDGSTFGLLVSASITRTSAGVNFFDCLASINCSGNAAGRITGGISTFNESQAMTISCVAKSATATMSFLGQTVTFVPAP